MSDEIEPATAAFIARWGEFGKYWGLPRGAAQIHALLLCSDKPMNADEIASSLGIARSNVSTSIRALGAFGVVRTAPKPGDRKEYFEAIEDPWEAATAIAIERKAREYDRAMHALVDASKSLPKGPGRNRVAAYADLATAGHDWAEQMKTLPRGPWKSLFKLGAGISDFLTQKKKPKKKKG
ncbi:MAG: helix-turn-helix domain-containing protein [Pseudomonadota bacterium]